MAPSPHVKKAFAAMKALQIEDSLIKPVLKKLLVVYDRNWELIAEDNYRVLADAIFEDQETQAIEESKGKKKKAEEAEASSAAEVERRKKRDPGSIEEYEDALADLERPLKRVRRRGEGGSALTSPSLGSPTSMDLTTAPILLPFHPMATENNPDAGALIIPKDEPFPDMPFSSIHPDSLDRGNSSVPMPEIEKTNGHVEKLAGETASTVDGTTNNVTPTAIGSFSEHKLTASTVDGTTNDVTTTAIGSFSEHKLAASLDESSALELASSASGEVKINLSFAPATGVSNVPLPSMEELRRAMEEKCLRSYKILDPNFSVPGFMNDMCSCYLDLATKAKDSANQLPKDLPFVTTNIDELKKSAARMAFTSMGSNDHMRDVENSVAGDSMGLVVVPECQISADEWRLISSVGDITLGKEMVEIPWVNEVNDKVPPVFRYIAQSLIYLDAAVKFSLGNIRDDQCCSSCCGDCLAPSMSCSCATGLNGFAYTVDGLLQEDFLEQCISESRDPRKHVMRYCKECPLEKANKEAILEPCKGHLKRNVIKECWSKCGCVKKCGNRVVQQGIHKKLQVFFTPNGRGWGLRTLEKLPKGAFVCEFSGEILTIPELFQRSAERLTSPVILDAHWGSEGVSGDNKALCLDGTQYGNVSRFINHRCLDANLIEIPVHVETTDLHYYHLAFFATREIDVMEELTWDYGVEFNDHVFPTSPFHCRCGSEFCRNIQKITKGKNVKKRA